MQSLKLTVISGYSVGMSVQSDQRTKLTVGRKSSCQLKVTDFRMSREHFELHYENQKWILRDLGSKNGTWVNGIKADETPVGNGNLIVAGDTSFRLEFCDAPVRSRNPLQGLTQHLKKCTPDSEEDRNEKTVGFSQFRSTQPISDSDTSQDPN